MYVHEELALDVFGSETPKVYLVKDDAGRLVYAEHAHESADEGQNSEYRPFRGAQVGDGIVLDALGAIVSHFGGLCGLGGLGL